MKIPAPQRFIARLAALIVVLCVAESAGAEAEVPEPRLASATPLGGARGTEFTVTVRGVHLDAISEVWFECDDLSARIDRVEKVKRDGDAESDDYYERQKRKLLGLDGDFQEYEVTLTVSAQSTAHLGLHGFRLATPGGVSNALGIQIVDVPVVSEASEAHQTPTDAQVLAVPTVVNASLSTKGEKDFYSFEAKRGETLEFQSYASYEMPVSYNARVELSLHYAEESWFGGVRARPIVLKGARITWGSLYARAPWFDRKDFAGGFYFYPRLRHTFEKDGRYLIAATSFLGQGGPGHDYLLKVTRVDLQASSSSESMAFGATAHADPADWLERDSTTLRQLGSFGLPLGGERVAELWARSGQKQKAEGERAPQWFEGAIDEPGELDRFRFQVEAGERLAFEVETPDAAPPSFNPWLRVLDKKGQEVVANLYNEYGGNGLSPNRCVERKTIHTFPEAGEYTLEVRDLTTLLAGAEFRYRVLVRPQVPHLGRTELTLGVFSVSSILVEATDRLNLNAGEARKLTVLFEKEEGFDGDVFVEVDDLPSGVRVLPSSPASWTELLLQGIQYRPRGVHLMEPESHRPVREAITVLVSASPDAVPTSNPRFLNVRLRPVINDLPGQAIFAGRLPLMVVAASPTAEAASDDSTNAEAGE
ncbi:MAG: hypothetical protein MK538_04185 [Planctomycetes bacterium]|nr:hypothetical protein [Planctomycetota bacterium]